MTAGAQTIGGAKTFSSTIGASNFSGSSSGTNTGDITVATFGSTPTANGASLSGQALALQPADGTHPGLLTSGTQTIGGAKTFSAAISASNLSNTNTGDITLAAVGSTPGANGASLSSQVLTLQPADGTNPGLLTSGTQTIGGAKTFSAAISASNLSNTNTGDITVGTFGSTPTANGASLSSQVLTLQPADGTNPGLLTTAAQTLAGAKTFSTGVILPTSGGTGATLNYYETTTHATAFSGAATTGSITIQVERIGNIVCLRIPTMTIAFATPGIFTSGTQLLARFRPAAIWQQPVIIVDNNVPINGRIQMNTGGSMFISASVGGGNFTSGTTGWPSSLFIVYSVV
jgi:hypothetical protein